MSYPIAELIKLANRLESAAIVAEAKVAQHTVSKEHDLAAIEQARADSARHYVSVCHFFHGQLKKKEKAAAFVPPTLAEAKAFAESEPSCHGWPMPDVEKFWNHFVANGWKCGKGGTPMKNWHGAARNWAAGWRERHTSGGEPRSQGGKTVRTGTPRQTDPQGWREYLRKAGVSYVEYWRALPGTRKQFETSSK